jgi:hypothetical protein
MSCSLHRVPARGSRCDRQAIDLGRQNRMEDLLMKTFIGTVVTSLAIVLLAPAVVRGGSLPPESMTAAVASDATPEQHRALAEAYTREAEQSRAKALAHRQMDSWYGEPGYLSAKLGFPRHCRRLTRSYEVAARRAEHLARVHGAMAETAARDADAQGRR